MCDVTHDVNILLGGSAEFLQDDYLEWVAGSHFPSFYLRSVVLESPKKKAISGMECLSITATGLRHLVQGECSAVLGGAASSCHQTSESQHITNAMSTHLSAQAQVLPCVSFSKLTIVL